MCDCDLITAYVEDLDKQIETMKAVYLFGSPEDRDALQNGVLAVWVFVSTFLGPALRRRELNKEQEQENG